MTPEDLARDIAAGRALQLLDVREAGEIAIVALPGIVHVPLGQIPARWQDALDPDVPVVCICHHGIRSARAAGFLMAQGVEVVYNLRGGMDAYAARVDPSLPRY